MMKNESNINIPFLLEVAAVLAAFVPPNHIASLCSWDELTCRLPANPSSLGKLVIKRLLDGSLCK
ncbi:hypothetical protein XV76_10670 [Vibrio cholerae]|nr:hypothetical protein XV73_09360 [Vibrio cholerae]KQA37567.1 hypothetical protein XV72_00615 [Vibrio cholerae]KQA43687.1 hypothetical protein XV76_10670 [Vibrio cholerae]KQA65771.1 hypothetical protein XV82_15230 [Vibrio cholerae]KQA85415.1 hypothetical protein XV87_07290 [Vibrio cholerae]